MQVHFETVQTKGNRFWKWKRILKLSKLKDTDFENEEHFETVQTKGNRQFYLKSIIQ